MPKQSAKDELIARIDADLEQVHRVANYVGVDSTPALTARMEADAVRLATMRDYVTGGITDAPADTPKRTRGKGKRAGMPTSGWATTASEAEKA